MSDWKPAHTPPEGLPGNWTKDVVAVTNLRNVYRIAYFCPERGGDGVWQRPMAFTKGEVVEWWAHFPE
ncbi:hypothetical protein [Pseudomonas phage vB_PaS_IME307]|nr:hypothetical protein [Pseudomonas phage vB_PaS_IME307]